MKKIPLLLGALFISLTQSRVRDFVAGELKADLFQSSLFSVGLVIAVYVSAYWTLDYATRGDTPTKKSRDVSRIAWASLIFFSTIDGFFNLMEVNAQASPSWEINSANWIAVQIYGLFPTLAAVLLGVLQSRIDKLPAGSQRYNLSLTARKVLVGAVEKFAKRAGIPLTAKRSASEATQPSKKSRKKSVKYICVCGKPFPSQPAYAGHKRHCKETPGAEQTKKPTLAK